MAVPLIIAGGLMAAGAIGGAVSRRNKNKALSKMIKKRPKYEINQEAFDNQAIAKSRAFGRDRTAQMAQENAEMDAASAAAEARDITSSTSDLLATISAINANKNATKRGLAQDEAAIQNQNVNALYAANQAMIDEKDKEFYNNKVSKYKERMALLDAKKQEANSAWGAVFQAGSSMLSNYSGGGGK